jgi:hypothetical protein
MTVFTIRGQHCDQFGTDDGFILQTFDAVLVWHRAQKLITEGCSNFHVQAQDGKIILNLEVRKRK